nr:hypothetical protein [Streptomyces olivoverticillatus]
MASHARHARSAPVPPPRLRRTLRRVGVTVSAGAALVAAGAAEAQAAQGPQAPRAQLGRTDIAAAFQGTGIALEKSVQGLSPVVKTFKYHPLAATPVDPVDNGIGTKIADFKPISTQALTNPIHSTGQLRDLPLVGQLLGILPG